MKLSNAALVCSFLASVTSLAAPLQQNSPLELAEDPPLKIRDTDSEEVRILPIANEGGKREFRPRRNRYIVKLRDAPSPGGNTEAQLHMKEHSAFIKAHAQTQRFANLADQNDEYTVLQQFDTVFVGYTALLDDVALGVIKSRPDVEYVEPDTDMYLLDSQANPASWGLDRIDSKTGLDDVFNYPFNAGQGVYAYILDTGIKTSHQDFDNGRARMGPSFVPGESTAEDFHGHGTHVAGTIGGKYSGIAKKCTLVGVKVLSRSGSGATSGIVQAIEWVVQQAKAGNQRAVINMSLGGSVSRSLNDAVTSAAQSGVTVVVAAGNNNGDACQISPASASGAITVGATDRSDTKASYSNWGSCVHVNAPGSSIVSSDFSNDNGLKTMSGTSMATPHVVGVAAAMLSQRNYSPAELKSAIMAKATAGVLKGLNNGTPNLLLFLSPDGSVPSPTDPDLPWC